MREISEAGVKLIESFEGLRLKPYRDPVGIRTIGFGHVIRRGENFTVINISQAERLLQGDLVKAEQAVTRLVPFDLSDNEARGARLLHLQRRAGQPQAPGR